MAEKGDRKLLINMNKPTMDEDFSIPFMITEEEWKEYDIHIWVPSVRGLKAIKL